MSHFLTRPISFLLPLYMFLQACGGTDSNLAKNLLLLMQMEKSNPSRGSSGTTDPGGEADPTPSAVIYIYQGGSTTGAFADSLLGGRWGADMNCFENRPSSLLGMCNYYKALVSIDTNDEIRDMPIVHDVPTDRAITSKSGTKIAENWADLLDGSLPVSLQSAGIASGTVWWSFSQWDGQIYSGTDSLTCNFGTSGSSSYSGKLGRSDSTSTDWIGTSSGSGLCNISVPVMCICY
ncbi:hypothetical protein [Leptospira wolffii]|uniref:hypothetical protein n=1 Tax=Leptospira wolffii TaxID=409998 RepID=UPI0002DF58CA|nr:hypothetical protein [Leptospira wolffii]